MKLNKTRVNESVRIDDAYYVQGVVEDVPEQLTLLDMEIQDVVATELNIQSPGAGIRWRHSVNI